MATIQLSNDINTQNKRNHQKKGFNLNRQNTLTVVLNMGGISPLGAILRGKGAKQYKGGENAQPLIDH